MVKSRIFFGGFFAAFTSALILFSMCSFFVISTLLASIKPFWLDFRSCKSTFDPATGVLKKSSDSLFGFLAAVVRLSCSFLLVIFSCCCEWIACSSRFRAKSVVFSCCNFNWVTAALSWDLYWRNDMNSMWHNMNAMTQIKTMRWNCIFILVGYCNTYEESGAATCRREVHQLY